MTTTWNLSHRKITVIISYLIFFNPILYSQHSYDVKHYNLIIEPDFQKKELSVRAQITIDNPNLEDTLYFWLNNKLQIEDLVKITEIGKDDNLVSILLKQPTGDLLLDFKIHGSPGKSGDEDRMIISDSSLFLLWSDCWYPMDFEDWATVRTEIILPEEFAAIAPGQFVSFENKKYIFETSVPSICFSVFADSRWVKTEHEVNGIKMLTLLYPESQKYSEQIFSTAAEILRFFSEICYPYPYDKYAFVTIENIYARRAFSDFVGYSPAYLEKEFNSTGHDAHETSLLWWGYLTRGTGPGSFQWTEGFGDYIEILYDEKFNKPIPKIFQYFRDEYLKLKTEDDVHYTELRGNTQQSIVHGKYPWLIHVMRYVVGDTAFMRGLRLLFDRYKYKTFTIDEFISTFEEGCGQSLKWWHEEWLERKGVPEIKLTTTTRQNGDKFLTQITIEQPGKLYHIPLEIGVELEDGKMVKKIPLRESKTILTIETKKKPTRIVADPNGWLLMKIVE